MPLKTCVLEIQKVSPLSLGCPLTDLSWNILAQTIAVAKQSCVHSECDITGELELPEAVAISCPRAFARVTSSQPPLISAAAVLQSSLWAQTYRVPGSYPKFT